VHAVTKILVVFCAILCLLLAALTMAFAANADAIVRNYKSMEAALRAAETAAKNDIAQYAQERVNHRSEMDKLQNQISQLNSQVASLQSDRTSLRAAAEQAAAEAASIRGQIGQLTATTQTQASVITNYYNEVTGLRRELLAATKREIELVDRLNDLESAREVLEQNSRALKEQLEEAKMAMQSAGRAGGDASASDPREAPGPLIRARVLDVVKSPAGEDLVIISEGANRGVRPNTLMHIVRGSDTFIGSIVITTVEPGQSIGRLNLYGRQNVQVQRDDMVLSRLTW
jgi:outer membrane murein-binding lipoprotein Lpp